MERKIWTRDELILVLDLYLKNRKSYYLIQRDILAEYSNILQKMYRTQPNEHPKFRSIDSVEIRLRNYASVDPYWIERGKKGLHNSKTAEFHKVWKEFHNKPEIVSKMAENIKRSILAKGEVAPHDSSESLNISVSEGKKKLVTHYKIERDTKLRRKKIDKFRKKHGKLYCEICRRDYANYDECVRERVFEVHHIVPPALASENVKTTFDDLSVLCANCHRAIHGYEEVPTIDQMRAKLENCLANF